MRLGRPGGPGRVHSPGVSLTAMDVDLRHSPSFAAARVTLEPGEKLRAESGAMMATSSGVAVESSTQGGLMKGLKRSVLGGESLFVTTFTAPAGGGWVDVAHHLAGDIIVAGVTPDQPMSITQGCWLASSAGVELDTKWGGFKNLFGGEGGFLVHASGQGTILLACYGALDTIQPGRRASRSPSTPATWWPSAPASSSQIRKVATGVMATLKSGEGFVFDFTGPGLGHDPDPQPERPPGLDPHDHAGRDRAARRPASSAASSAADAEPPCATVTPTAGLRSGDRRAARMAGYRPATAPMTRAAPTAAPRATSGHDHRPRPGRGVGGGHRRAQRGPAHAAEGRQQERLGQELQPHLAPGRPQGPPQPDLRPSLEDRDHHHVGDPDPSDQQGDRPQPEEQGGEGVVGGGLGRQRVGRAADPDLLRVGRVGGGRQHRPHRLHRGVGRPGVDGARVAAEARAATRPPRSPTSAERSISGASGTGSRTPTTVNHCPPRNTSTDGSARHDAQPLGGHRPEHHRRVALGGGVEEPARPHRAPQHPEQVGAGRLHRDPARLRLGDEVGAADGGRTRSRWRSPTPPARCARSCPPTPRAGPRPRRTGSGRG